MRILLVEDDTLIGDGIRMGLRKQGFSVDWLTDGSEARHALTAAPYNAVVLDLTLPGADGLDILRAWRKAGQAVPVLVLTARGTLHQRVEGLNLGADDYLGKPFALEELTARLLALLRRSHGQATPELEHGGVRLNPQNRQVTLAGAEVSLSPKGLALLEILLLNKNAVLSKAVLEEKLYPFGEEVSSNAVEVHVHHLRQKLGTAFIRTVHGLGYTLGGGDEA